MRMTFDREADAAYVYLVPSIDIGQVAHSHICDIEIREGAIIMQFDEEDRLLGLEILGASKILSESVLKYAEQLS